MTNQTLVMSMNKLLRQSLRNAIQKQDLGRGFQPLWLKVRETLKSHFPSPPHHIRYRKLPTGSTLLRRQAVPNTHSHSLYPVHHLAYRLKAAASRAAGRYTRAKRHTRVARVGVSGRGVGFKEPRKNRQVKHQKLEEEAEGVGEADTLGGAGRRTPPELEEEDNEDASNSGWNEEEEDCDSQG